MPQAPVAPRRPSDPRPQDGVVDPYAWLRDKDDPAVTAHLEAENAYTESSTEHIAPLRDALFDEIKSRILETDLSVPSRKGPWWNYSRTEEGQQYPIICRKPVTVEGERVPSEDAVEHVTFDMNAEAGDSPYFSVGALSYSPDFRLLAHATDFDGNEIFDLRVRDLHTGEELSDEIPGVYYGATWSNDGRYLFYSTLDDAHRPYRLWRHELGTDASADVMVFQEDDERFFLGCGSTRDDAIITLQLGSGLTSEVWILDANDPTGEFRCVRPRETGVEYHVDHHSGTLLIVTNEGDRKNFCVQRASVDDPGTWHEVIAHDDKVRIEDLDAFADHVVVWLRAGGLAGARVHRVDRDELGVVLGESHDLVVDEPIYTIGAGSNPEFETDTIRYGYTSLVTPSSVMDYVVAERRSELRKQQPVLGGYNPADYESAREWATASDGERIPISLVWRKGTPRDGTSPCLLYGYGSYEISIDPTFSSMRLSLLDRGFVFAIAHIRGGGEMGRLWYESAKFLTKPITFTDFDSCAEHLIAQRWTSSDRLVARGGSAGGMLMGAVLNQRPDLYRGIVAEVPFVDCLNTMLDSSIPLTTNEYEEWGNPEEPQYFDCIKSYAPYENVPADTSDYPAMLVTAGISDPRVGFWEPAKWVAKLRATGAGSTNPLLFKIEMGAGHAGPSGRYDAWRDEAFVLSFILDTVGLS